MAAAIVETLMHGGGNRAFRGGWGVGFVCAPERTYGDFKTQIPATSRYFSCWSGSNCRRHRPAGTEQEGVGRRVGLPYGWVGLPYGSNPETCPVRALRVWVEASAIESGPLFRSITRHGKIQRRLSGYAVAIVVKRYAGVVGLATAA
jgi:hypothetical protein